MLRMEISQMTRTTDPVGSRFASLPLALIHLRNAFQPRWPVTSHSSLVTGFLFGNKVTIEFAVTYSKQRVATNSNR
jgi:hypothetical protein